MDLVLATMRDKPATAMLRSLAPLVQEIVVTSIPARSAAELDDLARCAAPHGRRVTKERRIPEALQHARRAVGPDGLVVVSGSLYLVGEVKRVLREE
jgi:dihydrofolate synthase/folylpolyglutamate synthase